VKGKKRTERRGGHKTGIVSVRLINPPHPPAATARVKGAGKSPVLSKKGKRGAEGERRRRPRRRRGKDQGRSCKGAEGGPEEGVYVEGRNKASLGEKEGPLGGVAAEDRLARANFGGLQSHDYLHRDEEKRVEVRRKVTGGGRCYGWVYRRSGRVKQLPRVFKT